jgi:hypothetical protein
MTNVSRTMRRARWSIARSRAAGQRRAGAIIYLGPKDSRAGGDLSAPTCGEVPHLPLLIPARGMSFSIRLTDNPRGWRPSRMVAVMSEARQGMLRTSSRCYVIAAPIKTVASRGTMWGQENALRPVVHGPQAAVTQVATVGARRAKLAMALGDVRQREPRSQEKPAVRTGRFHVSR